MTGGTGGIGRAGAQHMAGDGAKVGIFLICVTVLNPFLSRRPQKEAGHASVQPEHLSDQWKSEAEALQALGMSGAGYDRWQVSRRRPLEKGIAAAGVARGVTADQDVPVALQSAMLGFRPWSASQEDLTAGAMIVSPTLMGHGVALIKMAVGQWAEAKLANEA